jgi:hypothetical protein
MIKILWPGLVMLIMVLESQINVTKINLVALTWEDKININCQMEFSVTLLNLSHIFQVMINFLR